MNSRTRPCRAASLQSSGAMVSACTVGPQQLLVHSTAAATSGAQLGRSSFWCTAGLQLVRCGAPASRWRKPCGACNRRYQSLQPMCTRACNPCAPGPATVGIARLLFGEDAVAAEALRHLAVVDQARGVGRHHAAPPGRGACVRHIRLLTRADGGTAAPQGELRGLGLPSRAHGAARHPAGPSEEAGAAKLRQPTKRPLPPKRPVPYRRLP